MSENYETGALSPVDFDHLQKYIPELSIIGVKTTSIPLLPLIDSSDIMPDLWKRLAHIIEENYNNYDGFVILHGTDTMAYTASALSFMLENLSKPVILTGSQLPIGVMRTDAKENLLTAIEIAAAKENNQSIVPEVCIFFEDTLFRGNRTTKRSTEHFNAFKSHNYPLLAQAGVHIKYFRSYIKYPHDGIKLRVKTKIDTNIAILKIFPGITQDCVEAILNIRNLKAVILESFGTGNAPRIEWFYAAVKEATERGVLIINRSQCSTGAVEMGRYETSLNLLSAGVMSAHDCTIEAITTKLMCVLGECTSIDDVKHHLNMSVCGEMTVG